MPLNARRMAGTSCRVAGTEGAFGARRAHFQERYPEPVQGFGRFREQGLRFAVATALRIIVGRKPYTCPIGAGYADEHLGHLDQQSDRFSTGPP